MSLTLFKRVSKIALVLLLCPAWAESSAADNGQKDAKKEALIVQAIRVPSARTGGLGLEGLLVRPPGEGPFPLAVLTHGMNSSLAMNKAQRAAKLLPLATEFARRGWAVAIVMRRGYATSGGRFAENMVSCEYPDYLRASREAAQDLRTSILYLAHQPHIDGAHVIAIGASAGGMAVVALTADPPPGLIGAINFAGVMGHVAPDTVCDREMLVSTFWILGKKSRVPMLWVYSENDHTAPLPLAQRCYEEFAKAGGHVTFITAPPFRNEGHFLFSAAGIDVWTAYTDPFLQDLELQIKSGKAPMQPASLQQGSPGTAAPQRP